MSYKGEGGNPRNYNLSTIYAPETRGLSPGRERPNKKSPPDRAAAGKHPAKALTLRHLEKVKISPSRPGGNLLGT